MKGPGKGRSICYMEFFITWKPCAFFTNLHRINSYLGYYGQLYVPFLQLPTYFGEIWNFMVHPKNYHFFKSAVSIETVWSDGMIKEWWVRKDLERSNSGLIRIFFWLLPRGSEENHGKLIQDGQHSTWDLTQAPEYKCGMLPIGQPIWSKNCQVNFIFFHYSVTTSVV